MNKNIANSFQKLIESDGHDGIITRPIIGQLGLLYEYYHFGVTSSSAKDYRHDIGRTFSMSTREIAEYALLQPDFPEEDREYVAKCVAESDYAEAWEWIMLNLDHHPACDFWNMKNEDFTFADKGKRITIYAEPYSKDLEARILSACPDVTRIYTMNYNNRKRKRYPRKAMIPDDNQLMIPMAV